MKILIGAYILAAGARDSDEEAETSVEQIEQIAAAARATDAQVYRRGNRVFTFTFTKTREHESFQEAERFRLLHATEIPTTGTLTFVTESTGGSESAVYFHTHNVRSARIRQVGVSTISTYTITAAGPTTTRPTA